MQPSKRFVADELGDGVYVWEMTEKQTDVVNNDRELDSMRDHIRVGSLGLVDREVRILRSMFSLAPQLSENYVLLDPKAISTADVVLVNADDPSAFDEWNTLAQRDNLAVPIMLSANGKTIGNTVSMSRPIHFTALIEALENIDTILLC